MAELTDVEIDAALERGRKLREAEPRALSARYDMASGRVVIDLTNGCSFSFPPRLVQGLGDATDAEVAAVEVLGIGLALGWDALDIQISLGGLMAGIFGTKAYMARRAGAVSSPAKALAARTNGAKGGRPRKSAAG